MSLRRQRLLNGAARIAASDEPNVPSPCQSVCVMNPQTGWCEGCLRTLDEIAGWSRSDDSARRAIWRQLPERVRQADARSS